MSHDHIGFGPCKFVTVNGREVHLIDQGQGPVLLMVHGSQAWAYAWRHQIRPLVEHGYRAIAVDLPGSGYSDPMPGRIGIKELSEFLATLLDYLQLGPVTLAASSAGGLPILDLAIRHPERVNGLVLASTCGVPHQLPPLWRTVRWPLLGESIRLLLSPGLVRANLREAFFHKELIDETMVEAYLRPLLKKGAWPAQLRQERNWRPAFVEENLARISAACLLVWGGNDPWHPLAMAGEFKHRLPHAQFITLPQCGHLPHEEKPEEFNGILLDWLRELPGTGTKERREDVES